MNTETNSEERSRRIANEIQHGQKIASDAEKIWNWDSPAGRRRASRRADYLISLGRFASAGRLLEIGCGTGVFTEMVCKSTAASITAVDISPDLLQKAGKKIGKVDFRLADAMALDFADNSFDAVYGSSVLHHLEMDRALNEIFRVLKKGGRMVFAEPNMLNPQIFIERKVSFVKDWLGISPDETAIVRWTFAKMLRNKGFSNVRIFPYDFLHPATPVFLINTVDRIGRIMESVPGLREIAGSVIIYGEKN